MQTTSRLAKAKAKISIKVKSKVKVKVVLKLRLRRLLYRPHLHFLKFQKVQQYSSREANKDQNPLEGKFRNTLSSSGAQNTNVINWVDPTSFVQWLRQTNANYMTCWLLLCSEALKPKDVGIGSLLQAQWRSPDTELLLLRKKKEPRAIRHCLSLLTFFHSLECVFTWRRRPTNNLKVVLSSSFLSWQKVN